MARNEAGLVRSSMMDTIAKAKAAPKVLDHIRVHPRMGGGVMVEHHHTSPEHAPKVHNFAAHDGEKFADHMMKHTGMSWGGDEGTGAGNDVDKVGTES
jgi:hypothetical protein